MLEKYNFVYLTLLEGRNMKKIHIIEENSAYFGSLPTGCTYCGPGQKLVLLITGKCNHRCFYCPLSFKKRGKNVIYANELKVRSGHLEEIIDEAHAISAMGAGITGGNPMVVPELTIDAIRLLKHNFGESHHIHLYTTDNFAPNWVNALAASGLDELRFHPPIATWGKKNPKLEQLINLAKDNDLSVGAELPVLPGSKSIIVKFAKYLDSLSAEFLNLNELEFSESNWARFNAKGYKQKDPISNSVKGSEAEAYQILTSLANDNDLQLSVHYCSAQFKDRQQLTNRLRRRAKNVKRPFEVITDEPTFLLGIIEYSNSIEFSELKKLIRDFKKKFEIPDNLINFNKKAHRLELAAWVLEELKSELPDNVQNRCFIIEEYPTADRLEVERIPLLEFK